MLKLLKYLKGSLIPIIAILLLLVVQAISDLSLPEYTSRIVNVGIQQSGVDSAAPEVLREETLNKLTLFMSDSDREWFLQQYTPLKQGSVTEKEWNRYLKKYPGIADRAVYYRTADGAEALNRLESITAKPILIVAELDSGGDMAKQVEAQLTAALPPQMAGQNLTVYQILQALPAETAQKVKEAFTDKMDGMPDSILTQGAIAALKTEYEALGMDMNAAQTRYILWSGAQMLGIALISMLAAVLVGLLASRVGAALGRELRGRVFHKVVNFSSAEFNQFSTASLITRSTNDVQQIQMLMAMLLRIVFYAPILGIGGILKVLHTDVSMGWIIVLAVAMLLALVWVLFVLAMPKFKSMQRLVDRLNLVTREILTGLPVIRAFSAQRHEEERFDRANRDITQTNLFVNRVMSGMMPVMMLIMNGITLLIVWVGGHGVDSGAMQVGDLMAFIQYTMQIIMAFLMVSAISIMLPRASVSANRVEEILRTDITVRDPKSPRRFDREKKGLLEFRDVSFRYPGAEEDVLSHISFTVEPGKTTAIVGSTGSGKSTLLNLVPRFFDVTGGAVLVDGTDVREVTQHDLREKLGYVPQQGVLFSGTVESNLKYGRRSATEEEVRRAAAVAQATEFIEEKPEGYQEPISQGGANVSGGQKQRLSIARAVAIQPEIYLFDDTFSALDFRTEKRLRQALREETGGSTVLIVAQRVATILHADQIVVLEEGRLAGLGTHRELMENCESYRQIAYSQLSEEELA